MKPSHAPSGMAYLGVSLLTGLAFFATHYYKQVAPPALGSTQA